MNLVSRSLCRVGLLAAFAAALFSFGCGPKKVTPPPAQPAVAPPPATPTVTLQASPTSVNKGESATLSWNSTDATQLSIAPDVGAVTAQGSTKVTPSDTTTYTITASGPGGSASATANVAVNAPQVIEQPKGPTDEEKWKAGVFDAFFDYDKADLRPDARTALSKTAEFLKSNPGIKVTVEGHCDERGSTEYNLGRGDDRLVTKTAARSGKPLPPRGYLIKVRAVPPGPYGFCRLLSSHYPYAVVRHPLGGLFHAYSPSRHI